MLQFILFDFKTINKALRASIINLSPFKIYKNPVLFLIWMIAVCTLIITILGSLKLILINEPFWFVFVVLISIWSILFFANFVEAIAEINIEKYSANLLNPKIIKRYRKIENGHEFYVTHFSKGDIILVKKNEIIPCDGVIVKGAAVIDEAAITGESAAVLREANTANNTVKCGTLVISDEVQIIAGSDIIASALAVMEAKIAKIDRKAGENNKALNHALFGYSLTHLVMCSCLIFITKKAGIDFSIIDWCAVLVCLMPTTIAALISTVNISSVARLMKKNLLPITQQVVESAGDIDLIIFDKTGTLTEGKRKAVSYKAFIDSEKDFLFAAEISCIQDETIEGVSTLELLNTIKARLKISSQLIKEEQLIHLPFNANSKFSGNYYQNRKYIKGSSDVILAQAISRNKKEALEFVRDVGERGSTPLLVMVNDIIIGGIELADRIKPDIANSIEQLKKLTKEIVMVTGDNNYTTQYIANALGIEKFIYQANPDKKLEYVRQQQALGKVVAFVGDGANDAMSINISEVGLVMSSAAEVSLEAANVIDFNNSPVRIIDLIQTGKESLITKGCLTMFSLVSEIMKYFIVVPILFLSDSQIFAHLNFLNLNNYYTAIISAVLFNTFIILIMLPVAIHGIHYSPLRSISLVKKHFVIYGVMGLLMPIISIKILDYIIGYLIT